MTYHPFIANSIISGRQSGLKSKVRCSSIKNVWMMNEINIMAREWMTFPSLLDAILAAAVACIRISPVIYFFWNMIKAFPMSSVNLWTTQQQTSVRVMTY